MKRGKNFFILVDEILLASCGNYHEFFYVNLSAKDFKSFSIKKKKMLQTRFFLCYTIIQNYLAKSSCILKFQRSASRLFNFDYHLTAGVFGKQWIKDDWSCGNQDLNYNSRKCLKREREFGFRPDVTHCTLTFIYRHIHWFCIKATLRRDSWLHSKNCYQLII